MLLSFPLLVRPIIVFEMRATRIRRTQKAETNEVYLANGPFLSDDVSDLRCSANAGAVTRSWAEPVCVQERLRFLRPLGLVPSRQERSDRSEAPGKHF